MVARKGFLRYNKHINNAELEMDNLGNFEKYKVAAWKEQLVEAGLYEADLWKTDKEFPHATRVVREFYTIEAAAACYNALRQAERLGVLKNWLS